MQLFMGRGELSWKTRLRIRFHQGLRQVPCLHEATRAILKKFKCISGSSYQTLGQDEDDEGWEVFDDRQWLNKRVGMVLVRTGVFCVVITIGLMMYRSMQWQKRLQESTFTTTLRPLSVEAVFGIHSPNFKEDIAIYNRDLPLVLYLGALQIATCGGCAFSVAEMYRRRRHALKHPASSPEEERKHYVKVELEKQPGMGDLQQYGLVYRPSTDGLECLIVEGVRPNSLLEAWNQAGGDVSPEDKARWDAEDEQRAAAAGANGAGNDAVPSPAVLFELDANSQNTEQVASRLAYFARLSRKVHPYSLVVAVNDCAADVGMMQLELKKPKITMWLRSEINPTRGTSFDEALMISINKLDDAPAAPPPSSGSTASASATSESAVDQSGPQSSDTSASSSCPSQSGGASSLTSEPGPTPFGKPQADGGVASAAAGEQRPLERQPCCISIGLEDEDSHMMARWCVCGIFMGWVTVLPALLMQPHEERPRQQLYRKHLMKPAIVILPIWILFWLLDCVELIFHVKIIAPFWYFSIVHMLLPMAFVWSIMQLQAHDEQLVLEQRAARAKEAKASPYVCLEDPSPVFLKELIASNPVSLLCFGTVAAVPILVSSLLTPMRTARGKLAQGYLHIMYAPLIALQVAFLVLLWFVRFQDLPAFYMAMFTVLCSGPCFGTMCLCCALSSRYASQDIELMKHQRREQAAKHYKAVHGHAPDDKAALAERGDAGTRPKPQLVDCSQVRFREWELIYCA